LASTASFRDPGGVLLSLDGRIFRLVNSLGIADLTAFLESKTARKWLESKRLVRSTVLDVNEFARFAAEKNLGSLLPDTGPQMVLEHERIPFPSYPHEWPAEMLHCAGVLTVELSMDLLREGFCLKDATPLNVLYRGSEPVFIDLLSMERRDPHDPTWLPYAQFVRTFLLPLLAYRNLGIAPHEIFLKRRDGLEPEEVYNWLGPLQRLSPQSLGLVTIPKWLGSKAPSDHSLYSRRVKNPEQARFIMTSMFRRLGKTLRKLERQQSGRSVWSTYMESLPSYTSDQFKAKESFVSAAYREFSPRTVLDIGCNTGHFSMIAARQGASVVSIDYDPVVIGSLWSAARREEIDLLPLVVNLAWPSPGIGWRNAEIPSFLDRCRGRFDFVLMLAVLHHLAVSERVPLTEILGLASELTTRLLLIEYVGKEDPMFKKLLRGRDHLYGDWTQERFETKCLERFEIVRSAPVASLHRRLYLLKKRVDT
jgi:SAM-dependent methyltransferase